MHCEVAQAVQLLQDGSTVRLVARRFGVSLVFGGDFERLVSTLGELDRGAEGPQHINGLSISFCLLGDSDEALPIPYKVTCCVALGYRFLTKLSETNTTAVSEGLNVHLLAWSSSGMCLPENTSSPLARYAFYRWKSVHFKWIRRKRKGLEKHRGTLSCLQHRPTRQVRWWVSNGLGRHFLRRTYGPTCA